MVAERRADGRPGCTVTTRGAASRSTIAATLVSRLDYSKGKLTYLSDLEPAKVVGSSDRGTHRRTTAATRTSTTRRPASAGRPESRIAKGLALHAHTELEYDLKGEYREFKAVAGHRRRRSAAATARPSWSDRGRRQGAVRRHHHRARTSRRPIDR